MRVAAFGAAALVLSNVASPSLAQDIQVANIQATNLQAANIQIANIEPGATTISAVADPVSGEVSAAQSAASALTSSSLAAYVARQQAQKGFNIFGDAPQPQLTSALVSAYAATHYRSNAALEAIDSAAAAAPQATSFSTDEAGASLAQPDTSTVSDAMLENYAQRRFQPTARKVAHAEKERLCLTKAIYHEARGESDDGQWAVANVVINRALSKRFPSTMCGVVFQNADQGRYRCQFTFACDGQPDMATERRAWAKANRIADAAYSEFQHGQRPGVVPGSALFYHTRSVSTDWGYKRVAEIGAHIFYSPM